jgi:hypothetical protein
MITARVQKDFLVVAQSTNTNSFGLRQHVLVARDGATYKLHLNYLDKQDEGTIITASVVTFDTGQTRTDFPKGEVPQYVGVGPAEVVAGFWEKVVQVA